MRPASIRFPCRNPSSGRRAGTCRTAPSLPTWQNGSASSSATSTAGGGRPDMPELQRQALSRDNPWPGLDPFDEADQGYFHGRSVESGEILRLVRRELLTVLCGRSGLGTTARRFEFKRSAAKIVLSFREDFLAGMEGPKGSMPSLMYNRFRLPAMSGAQAYEVITLAGGELVDDAVARQILRLAWKNEPSPPVDPAEFPRLEIDPALLSVVCSELNHKRQQASPPLERITPEPPERADREILSGFYERAMVGLNPRVRAFVEDELITQ